MTAPRFPAAPPAARAAVALRVAAHPEFAPIEAQAGPLPWRVRPAGFPGLLAAIVGQQISNQAAGAIWRRLRALPDADRPEGLLALPETALREAGLSRPKIAHARSLAEACAAGTLDPERLAGLDDAAAVAAISAVRGLGQWSAEVYLLFAEQRADVFPAGDLALAGAVAALRGLPARPGPRALRELAADWAPWRGLAARLLWHHWRYLTGRPAMDEG